MDSIINIMENSTVRIDTATQKGSVIDVVKLVLGCDSSNASTAFTRLKNEFPELEGRSSTLPINGKGRLTPVADAKTLIEIIFLLPGKTARGFLRKSAASVCRLMSGDSTLVPEIEQRRASLQSSVEGRATQRFLLERSSVGVESQIESYEGVPAGFGLLNASERSRVAKETILAGLERERQALDRQSKESLRDIGVDGII